MNCWKKKEDRLNPGQRENPSQDGPPGPFPCRCRQGKPRGRPRLGLGLVSDQPRQALPWGSNTMVCDEGPSCPLCSSNQRSSDLSIARTSPSLVDNRKSDVNAEVVEGLWKVVNFRANTRSHRLRHLLLFPPQHPDTKLWTPFAIAVVSRIGSG